MRTSYTSVRLDLKWQHSKFALERGIQPSASITSANNLRVLSYRIPPPHAQHMSSGVKSSSM